MWVLMLSQLAQCIIFWRRSQTNSSTLVIPLGNWIVKPPCLRSHCRRCESWGLFQFCLNYSHKAAWLIALKEKKGGKSRHIFPTSQTMHRLDHIRLTQSRYAWLNWISWWMVVQKQLHNNEPFIGKIQAYFNHNDLQLTYEIKKKCRAVQSLGWTIGSCVVVVRILPESFSSERKLSSSPLCSSV